MYKKYSKVQHTNTYESTIEFVNMGRDTVSEPKSEK